MTLDVDVESLLRNRMRERDLTFKEALNQALRAALTGGLERTPKPFELRTFQMGFRPEVALDQALSLAAASEDEEIVRKLSVRK